MIVVKSPNFTQIPNELFDDYITKLTPTAFVILLVIFRKTIGWHKLEDDISVTQFQEVTGYSRPTVIKCLKELIEKEYITCEKAHGNIPAKYRISMLVGEPCCKESLHRGPESGKNSLPQKAVCGKNSLPTKEREEKYKKNLVQFFNDLFQERYKTKPLITSAQASALNILVRKMGEADVEKKLRLYFKHEYWFTRTGRDIFAFVKMYNQIQDPNSYSGPKERRCSKCGAALLGTSTLCKECGADN